MEWLSSVKISIYLAFLTALFSVFLSVISVYFLKSKFPKSTSFWLMLVHFPRALPPTVVGFYLIYLFSPTSFLGNLLAQCNVHLLFTFSGILFASLLFNFSFAFTPILTHLENEPKSWLETCLLLNVSYKKYLFLSLQAQAKNIRTVFFTIFSQTLGEFGLVMMVGGSLPNETKVASIEIFQAVETMNYTQAHQISMVLLCLSMLSFLFQKGLFGNKNKPF